MRHRSGAMSRDIPLPTALRQQGTHAHLATNAVQTPQPTQAHHHSKRTAIHAPPRQELANYARAVQAEATKCRVLRVASQRTTC